MIIDQKNNQRIRKVFLIALIPAIQDEELIRYVKAVNALGGPVTINIGVYQDGTASPATLQQIQKLGHTLGVLK